MDNKEYLETELKRIARDLDAITLEEPDKVAYVLAVAHAQEGNVDIVTLTNCSATLAQSLLNNTIDVIQDNIDDVPVVKALKNAEEPATNE